MKSISRDGKIIYEEGVQDEFLKKLYGSLIGRAALKVLTMSWISKAAGWFMDTRLSTLFIDSFIKNNQIDLKEYVPKKYHSFNDCFTRKIKKGARPIDEDPDVLISPADGRVSVYKIDENAVFEIKNSKYTLESIVRDKKLAKEFQGGYLIIVRLCVDNYHRYCFADSGYLRKTTHIDGVLHTVNPIANDYYKIYKENSRSYSIIDTDHFDNILQMEFGALMVGKIVNRKIIGHFDKGSEKGKFEYGGSTVAIAVKKDVVNIDSVFLDNTADGYETRVKMGESLARKKNR